MHGVDIAQGDAHGKSKLKARIEEPSSLSSLIWFSLPDLSPSNVKYVVVNRLGPFSHNINQSLLKSHNPHQKAHTRSTQKAFDCPLITSFKKARQQGYSINQANRQQPTSKESPI